MRICIICPEYPEGPHGGVGTLTRVVARELVRMNHEVRVIGVYPESYPSPDYEEDMGVKVWRLRKKDGKFSWMKAWKEQYRMIRKWAFNGEIDIIEAPDSSGWLAFWGQLPVPVVLRANGSNTYFGKVLGYKPNKLTRLLEKKSYQRADHYISASRFTADVTREVFGLKKDFTVIYNGIEIDPTLVVPEFHLRSENLIVFAGTFIEKKGVIELVEAAKILGQQDISFRLEMYGKDTVTTDRGSMKELLAKRIPPELSSRIQIRGHVTRDELFQLYKTAACAVYPSYAEAFALAPLEAMTCGCPVVNTKLGSGSELIIHGEDGLLINPADPLDIADALKKILQDKTFAQRIGEGGLKKVTSCFSKQMMAEESLKCFEKTIQQFTTKTH